MKRRRHAAIRAEPFPDDWRAIIDRRVAYVSHLSSEDRAELFEGVQVFLAEKRFEGCNGLEITDEVRVTIAAQACILLLHRDDDKCYPGLDTILVYPSTFVVPGGHANAHGVVDEAPEARLGESWANELVVLAWDSVLAGAADARDGHNVVLHEFAHQLDQDGAGNGTPTLARRARYTAWSRVLGHDYDALVEATKAQRQTLIDAYGATNPAEFFAVVTETFFEKPHALRARHPELYEQLQTFYRQDPAALVPALARPHTRPADVDT